jgi:hypothetical protein
VRHVFAQLVLINIAVLRQTRAELIQRVAFFSTRQASNNIAGQFFDIGFACGVKPCQRLLLLFCGVIRSRTFALQNV